MAGRKNERPSESAQEEEVKALIGRAAQRCAARDRLAKSRFVEATAGPVRPLQYARVLERFIIALFENHLLEIGLLLYLADKQCPEGQSVCQEWVNNDREHILNVVLPELARCLPPQLQASLGARLKRILLARMVRAFAELDLRMAQEPAPSPVADGGTRSGLARPGGSRKRGRDPERAALIRTIQSLHAQGLSHRRICRELDRRKLARPAGARWHKMTWVEAIRDKEFSPSVYRWLSAAIHDQREE